MKCENWNCWKEGIELALKVIFVAVFTWGVISAVCCMDGCSKTESGCCKTSVVEGKSCSKK